MCGPRLSIARWTCFRSSANDAGNWRGNCPAESTDQVYDALRGALQGGITLIIIEQVVHRARGMADNCCILRRGQVVWSGSSVAAVDSVLDHYLGSVPEQEEALG